MFRRLAELNLSRVDAKLEGADGLGNVVFQGTDIHKHARLKQNENKVK